MSIVGTSGAALFLWGQGRGGGRGRGIIISWPPLEESAKALGKLGSDLSEPWPVSGEAAESRDPCHLLRFSVSVNRCSGGRAPSSDSGSPAAEDHEETSSPRSGCLLKRLALPSARTLARRQVTCCDTGWWFASFRGGHWSADRLLGAVFLVFGAGGSNSSSGEYSGIGFSN